MEAATLLTNIGAYSAQVALLVAAGAVVPRVLRVPTPGLAYLYWRALLVACLLLPWLQGRAAVAPDVQTVSATVGAARTAGGAAAGAAAGAGIDPARLVLALLAAGAVARLLWLAIGLIRLRRLRAAGEESASLDEHDELQQTLGVRAALRFVPGLGQPVTFGALRPVVLLPAALRDGPASLRRAVLCHELLHAQRRDWLLLVAEEIVLAVLWFHPAIWWLVARVRMSREVVVDELTVCATGSRRVYIEALMAYANEPASAHAAAFAHERHLFHRIVLLSRGRAESSGRVVLTGVVLALLLLFVIAAAAPFFPLVASAPAVAVAQPVEASAPPEAPRAVPVAVVPSPSSSPGNVREIERPRARPRTNPPTRPVQAAPVVLPVTAAPSAITSGEDAPGPPLAPSAPLRVGGTIAAPRKIRDVKPVYPLIARSAKVSGIVIAEATIDTDGRVIDAKIIRSIPLLDQAALDAVRQWEFTPVLFNGVPVPVVMSVTINFQLS